jgi:hypothetical protein
MLKDGTKPSLICLQYYFQCFGLFLSSTLSSLSPEHKPIDASKIVKLYKALQCLAHTTYHK